MAMKMMEAKIKALVGRHHSECATAILSSVPMLFMDRDVMISDKCIRSMSVGSQESVASRRWSMLALLQSCTCR